VTLGLLGLFHLQFAVPNFQFAAELRQRSPRLAYGARFSTKDCCRCSPARR
jgi:hypothetical protein